MRYSPSSSVRTERTFSMRAGLVASTVTPGSTAPDVSLRTPAMPLVCCASAVPDAHIRHVDVIKPIQRAVRVMVCLPGTWRPAMTATLLFANVVRVFIPRHTGCQAGMDSRNGQQGQHGQQEWTYRRSRFHTLGNNSSPSNSLSKVHSSD